MRKKSVILPTYEIDDWFWFAIPTSFIEVPAVTIDDTAAFEAWKQSNVIAQNKRAMLAIQSAFRRFFTR
jgi:sulfite reductase (ferredoxin)